MNPKLLAQVLELAPEGVVGVDSSGKMVIVNTEAEKMFGYSRKELLGKKIEKLLPKRFRARHVDHRARYVKRTEARPMGKGLEIFGLRKNGEEFAADIALSPVKMGPDTWVMATVRDMTPQKAAENALKESEAKFRSVVDASSDAVLLMKRDGAIIYRNKEARKMFGYAAKEMVGIPAAFLMAKKDRGLFARDLARYRQTGESNLVGKTTEVWCLRKNGENFPAEITLNAWSTTEGLFFSGILRDIGPRLRTQEAMEKHGEELAGIAEELKRSNQELEIFAYAASHDLKEPLRMVATFAELISKRYRNSLDAEANEFIDYIMNGAKRMGEIINDLLDYSRVTRQPAPREKIDFSEILEEVRADLQTMNEGNKVEIIVDPLPAVAANRSQMAQLFQNLIGNAVKFHGPEPPKIRVSAKSHGKEWIFSVSDNGIGIEPEYYDRIFMLFQRLHSTDEFPGTGLGLAICDKIVKRHGGRIWVESTPGKGSTFYFTLPR